MSEKPKEYFLICLGSISIALGFNMFLVPNSIAAGGAGGNRTILYHSMGIPVSLVVLVINLVLFAVGLKLLTGENFAKTIFATVVLSVVLEITSGIKPVTTNHLLSAVYGGVMFGVGTGLTVSNGGSTGGTDLAAVIIHKKIKRLSVARLILFTDLFVIVLSGVVFKDYEIMLCAAIALYIATHIADDIIEGVNFTKLAYVISDKNDLIAKDIMNKLDRGVTSLNGKGMYRNAELSVLMCAVRKSEFVKFKDIVNNADESAFIILLDARQVIGKGFKTND